MKYPRIRLEGTDLLKRAGVIYSQILNDLLMKVDEGDSFYPKGFLHTSTTRMMTPCYYPSMWSRDAGRGLMELARAGLTEAAGAVTDFIISKGLDLGDHYGRVISWFDEEQCAEKVLEAGTDQSYEVDGNANLLLGIYMYWKYSGSDPEKGAAYLDNADRVFGWFEQLGNACPHGFLLASASELSGNPFGNFIVYSIYATYGGICALRAYAEMAEVCGRLQQAQRYTALAQKFAESMLEKLVSKGPQHTGQDTRTPQGVWLNGLEALSGKAAETGDFGPRFPVHRWTRQLPYVLDFDCGTTHALNEKIAAANDASYQYIKDGMTEGYYFRKYGFVSCTCFSGMGNRHDDTMAGYGQNLFSQAALLQDDVNVYTKCIEGICRLAYDGDVVRPLTPDSNPWVMHECFCYENYEQGYDHTFGCNGDDEKFIMHNPGDEGNLVQSSETLKTFAIMTGISTNADCLEIKPRLPWECTEAEVVDIPVIRPDRSMGRISYTYRLNRWKNEFVLHLSGIAAFRKVLVRIGPLPYVLCNEKELAEEWRITRAYQASFAEKTISPDGEDTITVILRNEK